MKTDKKILSERETLAELSALFGAKGKDIVWLTTKNHWGDRRPYAYGFWIGNLADFFGIVDEAPPGYSHQYPVSIEAKLETLLKDNGFTVVDVTVGSWVHGWIHQIGRAHV